MHWKMRTRQRRAVPIRCSSMLRRAAVSAERRARAAKLNLLEQELISLPARQASTTARRDLAAAKYDKLAKRIPIVEAHVNKLKDAEAAKRQAAADREAKRLSAQHPLLEAYVKDTEVIRQRGADATAALDEGKSKLAEIQADLVRVRDSKVAAQQVLEIGSIGGEFSELLRAMRAQLPETARLQRRIADRDQAIVDARLRRLQAEEARRALSDTGGMADRVLAANTKRGDQQLVPADVRPALEKLVAARRDLYVQLHDSLVTRIAQLAELNGAERDLLNQTTQLRALLNSRLLWLPTSGSIGIGWLDQVRASFGWIVDLEAWKATAQTLFARAIDLPVPTALVLFAFGVLVAFSRRLSKRLARIAEAVGRYSTDNYLRTPEALMITGLLAVKTPLLFGYAGWLLVQPPLEADFTLGAGVGLLAVAYLLLFLRLIQFICAQNGLFSAHFGWSEQARATLYQNTLWLKYIITPIAFILGMINASSLQSLRDGLGRFAFLAGGIAVSLYIARVIDPRRGIIADRLTPAHPLWMTRVVWHTLLSLLPLAIAGLALWGYYDGASQIRDGLLLSVAIIVGAFLVYSVAMREVLVARRRLEIKGAVERRERARAQAIQEAKAATGELPPPPVEEPEVDIASISDQTRQLVRLAVFLLLSAALYFFWREALPSLALLDVQLWQQAVMVDGATRTVPVTVSNVVVALAIVVDHVHRGPQSAGPLGDHRASPPARRGRHALCHQRREPLPDRHRRPGLRLPEHRVRLEPGSMDRGGARRRRRLRPAGDRRQLHLRPHHPVRAASARRRHRHHRQPHRNRVAHPHPRHQHDRRREPRDHHPEQVADHRQGHQLDADRQHHPRDAQDRHRLRHRHAARSDGDTRCRQSDTAGARFSGAQRVLHRLRRIRTRIRSARVRAAAGAPLDGYQRPARRHRARLAREGNLNVVTRAFGKPRACSHHRG